MFLFQKLWRKAMNASLRTIVIISLFVILGSAKIFQLIEPQTFPSFFADGLWFTMTTATTVGYGDVSPETLPGKLFGMLFYLYGIMTLTVLIGKLQSILAKAKQNREEGKIMYKKKEHYVFIDFTNKTKETIREIRNSEPKTEIVIIDESLEKHPMLEDDNVFFIHGDPSEEETLLKANIQFAKSVIVFSESGIASSTLADGKTLLIATTVESLSIKLGKEIHTCVEIAKEGNIEKFKHIKVNDFVLSNQSVSRLLAKSVMDIGISAVFLKLLSDRYGDNVHVINSKSNWNTYGDAARSIFENGATLIAVGENLDVAKRANEQLPEDQSLFIVGDKEAYNKIMNF